MNISCRFVHEKSHTFSFLQLHVHANVDSLYDYVPKIILPQEYGGEVGPIDKITGMLHKNQITKLEFK
jgi:hypothetical protein